MRIARLCAARPGRMRLGIKIKQACFTAPGFSYLCIGITSSDMTTILIAILLLALLPDIYIWHLLSRAGVAAGWGVAALLPTVLLLAMAAAAAAGYMNPATMKTFFGVLLCVTLPKLLFTLVSVAGRCAALWLPSAAHRADVAAAVLAAALALAFLYGFVFGWRRITVRHVEVVSPHLPEAFDGYRVAHISDLHVGTWGDDTAFLGRFVGRVNALHPDVILFTGDLVNMLASEVGPHMGVLSRLEARDGVFSVLGNHDYCEYGRYDTRDGALRQRDTLIAREGEMGWRLLRDGNVVLRRGGDCMALIGVENTGRPPFPARGDLGKALEGVPAEAFKILLSHDPSHWRSEVLPATDIDLTLSGHTHAVQLRVGGFSPARWVYPEWGGLYREGDRALHVSVGAGGTVPFRLGAWPEITILTLRRR